MSRAAARRHYITFSLDTVTHHPNLNLKLEMCCSPVTNYILRLQQFSLQVSDGHFFLLQRGQVLLRIRGPDAVVVSTGVVVPQICSSI